VSIDEFELHVVEQDEPPEGLTGEWEWGLSASTLARFPWWKGNPSDLAGIHAVKEARGLASPQGSIGLFEVERLHTFENGIEIDVRNGIVVGNHRFQRCVFAASGTLAHVISI